MVVGGQFGSEGKGKIAAYLASEMTMAIRTGGPNAGHTIENGGKFCRVQSVPCAFINPSCTLALGAGAVIE
ncbi:MAG: adenylosuccinate synthetase [Pseudonocardiaceae bacterium]